MAGCGASQTTGSAIRDTSACADLAAIDACNAREDCVWEGRCRDPVDACEPIEPAHLPGDGPSFERGDPCERAQPGCAWSVRAQRCVRFVAVPVCPSTLAEAETAPVRCNHADQPPLACTYGDTVCRCVAPTYCGGPVPPPSIAYPASSFVCSGPVDARGCPTAGAVSGAPCAAAPDVVCSTCTTLARCVDGRWQIAELPPRP
jgi:hypothetical protein